MALVPHLGKKRFSHQVDDPFYQQGIRAPEPHPLQDVGARAASNVYASSTFDATAPSTSLAVEPSPATHSILTGLKAVESVCQRDELPTSLASLLVVCRCRCRCLFPLGLLLACVVGAHVRVQYWVVGAFDTGYGGVCMFGTAGTARWRKSPRRRRPGLQPGRLRRGRI